MIFAFLSIIWGLPWVTMLTPVLVFLPVDVRGLIAGSVVIVKAGALALQVALWLHKRNCTPVV